MMAERDLKQSGVPVIMITDENAFFLPGMGAVIEPAGAFLCTALGLHHMSHRMMGPGVINSDFGCMQPGVFGLAQMMVLL